MKMQATQPDYRYRLIPGGDPGGNAAMRVIDIHLDDEQRIQVPTDFQPPAWTRLDYHQCSHCPLDPAEYRYCPLALKLAYTLPDEIKGDSHQAMKLEVETPGRTYSSETTLQRALSSLFGLVSALSDCPHTRFLRPMALFHLPVSGGRESVVRVLAFRLLGRYLEHREHPELAVDLEGLDEAYRNLNQLNRDFLKRLRHGGSDAPVNAVLLLEMLTRELNWELEDELSNVAEFFRAPQPPPEPAPVDPMLAEHPSGECGSTGRGFERG
jgi:hypothetical protein